MSLHAVSSVFSRIFYAKNSCVVKPSLFLLLGPGPPVVVVDGGVLEEGEEDEAEAHHQVDVNGLYRVYSGVM